MAEGEALQRFEKIVQPMVEAINSSDFAGIEKDFSEALLKGFPRARSEPFFRNLVVQYGKITGWDEPKLITPGQAVFPVHFEYGAIYDLNMVLDAYGQVRNLQFLPPKPVIPVPERNETELSLPFQGKWSVVWGGDTKELNHHHDVLNQRYAFDFLIRGPDGKTHSGGGRKNEDYYAFGRELFAPGDGIVTEVIDGVRDNVPGSVNPYSAFGNAVFIRHREHEVSVLVHFKQGTIRVRAGDRVAKGQLIGLCGNSGQSYEPHLHYHLQNTEVVQDGTGIKVFFDQVVLEREGKEVLKEQYSPVREDIIAPPSSGSENRI